jgi:PAS domain S-box-containing protein
MVFVERSPLPAEQLIYAIGRDITDRKRSEAQLQHTQAFLNSVVENLPVGVFIKDAEGLHSNAPPRFVLWNKAGEEITGFTNEEMRGKTDYDFFPPEQADFFVAKDREVLASGQLLDIPEEVIETPHQGLRILHTRKMPINDLAGNPEYLLGICEDITERKQTEAGPTPE